MIVLAAVNASAQEPSLYIQTFGESSILMMEGIENRDEALLADASELYNTIPATELEASDYICEEITPGGLCGAAIQFNGSYCDRVRLNNFEIIELDPLMALRDPAAPVALVTGALKPSGAAEFTFLGADEMSAAVAATVKEGLDCLLITPNGETKLSHDPRGYVDYAAWTMGEEEPFTLKVCNPSAETVSFTIAIQ